MRALKVAAAVTGGLLATGALLAAIVYLWAVVELLTLILTALSGGAA